MMMEPLYEHVPVADKLADWKQATYMGGRVLTLADSASLVMATTPELEQALLNLGGGESGAAGHGHHQPTLSREHTYMDYRHRDSMHRAASTTDVCSTAELSPSSITDGPTASGNAYRAQQRRSAFGGMDNAGVPDTPASSLPSSGRSSPLMSTRGGESAADSKAVPLSSLDPKTQEELKKQRKKERNRIAAMKCRKRKLEREQELETKVRTLKQQNCDLSTEVTRLRAQIYTLKQTVMDHVSSGCNIFGNQL